MESFMFLGFGLDAWITVVTVLGMFTILLFTKWRSDLVFLGAIGVLYVTGVLDAKEAFSGFSSTSVITVGVLFVVVAGLTHTGVLQWIVKNLLGTPNSYSKAVTRLMLPVAVLSSFLSNTTVVTLFVNIVKMWARKLGVSPSKLLIPLSYASGTAKPDYQWTLRGDDGRDHEHHDHHHPWSVLSGCRHTFRYCHAPSVARS